MDAAFLVASPLGGRPIPEACRALVARHDIRLFERGPVDHVRWEAPGGAVVGAWQYDSGGVLDGTPWALSDAGFAMSTGNLRWPGGRWLGRSARAQRLLRDIAGEAPLEQSIAQPRGLFTAVVARADGHAAIGADPLGLRFVYYGSNDDVFVASSNATLAARALASDDRHPPRDPLTVAWLAFSPYRIGDRTGYRGVRLLPQSAAITLSPGEMPITRPPSTDPWHLEDELGPLHPDRLLDIAQEEIADSLRAAAVLPVERRLIDLTGGKDSRLVLAVVLSEGLADAFTFRTVGHEDLPDVRVAKELAERLGLRYSSGFPIHPQQQSYEEQLRGFLDASAGMTSIADLKPIRPRVTDEVQITGMHGECLRLKDRLEHLPQSTADLVDTLESKFRFGAQRLLRPEVHEELRSRFRAAVTSCGDQESEPLDAFGSYHLRHRARRLGGPLDDLHPSLRLLPLYSLTAIAASFAMGGTARYRERVHFELMKRGSEVLVTHPFVGPGWDSGTREDRSSATAPRPPRARQAAAPVGSPRPGAPANNLMARLNQESFELRRGTWAAVLDDDANPAWEIIDRPTALRTLEQYPSLDGHAQREFLGAITAALWLGEW